MKTKEVRYEKCFNLGNYENEKIGVTVEVEEGDNIQDIIEQSRNYVNLQSSVFKNEVEEKEHIVSHPEDFTGRQVEAAKEFLSKAKSLLVPKLSHISTIKE